MAQLNWLEEYSVGVEELDFHHKKIFALINELRASMNDEKKNSEDILLDLRDYADYHLSAEEKYFVEYKYKKAKKHTKKHNEYRLTIDKFINEKKKKNLDLEKILAFLEKWWMGHILKEDKKYKEFFNANNLY